LRRIGLVGLQIIGPEKYPAGVAVIVTALQTDPEPEIRAAAAQTLAAMYEKIEKGKFAQAREAISLALRSDRSAQVRTAAATALGLIDPEEARSSVLLLKNALEDPSPEVVLAAADTLRRLGKEASDALPNLVKLLKDPMADPLARTQAALALGRVGPPEAVQAGGVVALKETILAAETAPDLRIACVASVGFFGKDAADAVPAVGALLVLKATPLEMRRKAIDTLDQLGLDARPALQEILKATRDDDKHVRVRAIHALALMGKELGPELPTAVAAFNAALSDPAVDVRIAAINACTLLGLEGLGDSQKPILERISALTRDTQRDVADTARNALTKLMPKQP
jgi:HEAT repeat protein